MLREGQDAVVDRVMATEDIQVPVPATSECYLIWQKELCRRDSLNTSKRGGYMLPVPSRGPQRWRVGALTTEEERARRPGNRRLGDAATSLGAAATTAAEDREGLLPGASRSDHPAHASISALKTHFGLLASRTIRG